MKSLSYTVFLNFKNTVRDGMSLEYLAFYVLEVVPGFNQGFLIRRFHLTLVQNPWCRSCPIQKHRSGRVLMWNRP